MKTEENKIEIIKENIKNGRIQKIAGKLRAYLCKAGFPGFWASLLSGIVVGGLVVAGSKMAGCSEFEPSQALTELHTQS